MSLIRAHDVTLKCLPRVHINFEIERGESLAIVGRNGIGKTTLLLSILGEPVLVNGSFTSSGNSVPVEKLPPRELSKFIAYMPQEAFFPPELSVEDYLKIGLLPRREQFPSRINMHQSIDEIGTKLQIDTSKKTQMNRLSSGERQRVHLARVLLQETPLLLLDEPTNHLDPDAKLLFWNLLKEEQVSRKCGALIVTHDLEVARKYCGKFLRLSDQGAHLESVERL